MNKCQGTAIIMEGGVNLREQRAFGEIHWETTAYNTFQETQDFQKQKSIYELASGKKVTC